MPISKKQLYEQIDISEVETTARKAWEKEYKRRQSLERVIIGLVPAGIVLMAVIFFMLSAPHTQKILETITPGVAGFFSPLAWELGILIFSVLREAGWKTKTTWFILAILLCMSIFINVFGSLIFVIESSGSAIASLTIQSILAQFGTLPINSQIVLLVSIPVGFIIPIAAKLTGESLIKLALGRIKISTSDLEVLWAKEAGEVLYRSLLKTALKMGATSDQAGSWARTLATQMYGFQNRSEEPQFQPPTPLPAISTGNMALTPMQQIMQPQRVRADELSVWMDQNRERVAILSNREVAKAYTLEKFGEASESSYKTVERVRSR